LCELLQVPFSIEDPDYKGLELDVMSPCEKHGMASERLVAFEGTDTGRRFLACAQPVWIVGIVIFFLLCQCHIELCLLEYSPCCQHFGS